MKQMPSAYAETGLRARGDDHQIFHDQSLLIAGSDGVVHEGTLQGFYYANTRLLSRFLLQVNGEAPYPVQVHPARNDHLVAYFQDPRITDDAALQDRALLVQLTVTAGSGFHIDLDARNHSLAPIDGELSLLLEADFADAEEARHGWDASKIIPAVARDVNGRQQQAAVRRTCSLNDTNDTNDTAKGAGELCFDYLHPDLQEGVALRFSRSPRCVEGGVAWQLTLAPQEAWHACLTVSPKHEGLQVEPTARCYGAHAGSGGGPRAWLKSATRIASSNDTVVRTYDRALEDLSALALRQGPSAEQTAFAAGMPLYHNLFGRDLLTTSWQALLATPDLLESAILVCERYQGATTDDFRDEQPGRIMQQVRSGPLNLLNLNPRGRYYSDYSSPADFLIMVGQHFMWTGDRRFLTAHLPAAERVLAWIDGEADLDGDGFYEYQTRSPQGDRNQGWKDSARAIPHLDGSDAPLPIATCEVQGYIYAAKQQLGLALLMSGRVRWGRRLLREAHELQDRFCQAFWMADEGCVALALDGEKRQVRSIGSNAAHCLAAGIVTPAQGAAIANRLLQPDLFSGWGLRTLSADHAAYNPFSYHLGSVWTIEQPAAALGLKRYGFGEQASRIARGTFDLAERYQLHRLPESVGGLPRDTKHPFPGLYPQACWPQAWSAGAVLCLLQTMLGLRPIAPLGLLMIYPELPDWLPDLTLRGLRVGGSTLSIRFRRQRDGTTDYRILERQGRIRVLHEPMDMSSRPGKLNRLTDPLRWMVRRGL